jgi:hypothetical protein
MLNNASEHLLSLPKKKMKNTNNIKKITFDIFKLLNE